MYVSVIGVHGERHGKIKTENKTKLKLAFQEKKKQNSNNVHEKYAHKYMFKWTL